MWKRRLGAFLFGVVVIVAMLTLRSADPYAVRVSRETTFDIFQQIKPREAPRDLPVRIIDIDEASLAAIGQWPWSRQVMADMATRLFDLGAAVVAFDVLFPEPDRMGAEHDAAFAKALVAGNSVLVMSRGSMGSEPPSPKGGFAVTGADPLPGLPLLDGVAAPLPMLAEAATGIGVASLDRDGAGVARRLPLLWSNGVEPLPSLSVEALRIALGVSTLLIEGDTAGSGTVSGLRIGQLEVPTGPTGDLWLYYRELDQSTYVPAKVLLNDGYASLRPLLEGHIVLVGTSAAGLLDIRASALGEAVPGVSIHLQALEQMLTGTFLQRGDWVGGVELVLIMVTGLSVVLALIFTGPIVGLAISVVAAAVSTVCSWLAFTSAGVLIDPSFPLFSILVVYAAMAFFQFAVTDVDKRRIRRAFAHYVEPALLTQIEANANSLKLGGDVRELTVMFSDVRNFTALSERTGPAELVAILNQLFAALGNAIVKRSGTIDKFMGDAVMAFWNAPVDVPSHAQQACEAALEMRDALRALNERQPAIEPIAIGIGLSTGPALVGNVGFESRFNYSCIGDTVNVASRLEGVCKVVGYDILVTAETRRQAAALAFLDAGSVALKGVSEPEQVYLLVGDQTVAESDLFSSLAAEHDKLLETWRSGESDHAILDRCKDIAAQVEPRLAAFYQACQSRLGDFGYQSSESIASVTSRPV